jgi:hypothetical protein
MNDAQGADEKAFPPLQSAFKESQEPTMNTHKRIRQRLIPWLAILLAATALLSGAANVFAADESAEKDIVAQEKAVTESLLNAIQFLARQQNFSVTIRSSYDAIQDDGQMIEFGEIRKILVQRPDLMRAEVTRSDGDQDLLLFDGQTLTAYKSADNVFARVEHPGTIDSAIVYLVKDLQIRFPLARMLLTTLPEQLKAQIESIRYVEENLLYDVPVDHFAVRMKEVDVQIWVDQGPEPLLRRVVITYRNEGAQPQFRADFTAWNLTPETSGADFVLTPPADAEEILFLAPVKLSPQVDEKGGKS